MCSDIKSVMSNVLCEAGHEGEGGREGAVDLAPSSHA